MRPISVGDLLLYSVHLEVHFVVIILYAVNREYLDVVQKKLWTRYCLNWGFFPSSFWEFQFQTLLSYWLFLRSGLFHILQVVEKLHSLVLQNRFCGNHQSDSRSWSSCRHPAEKAATWHLLQVKRVSSPRASTRAELLSLWHLMMRAAVFEVTV